MNPITAFLAVACVLISLTGGYLTAPVVALLSFGSALVSGVGDDSRRVSIARFPRVGMRIPIPRQPGFPAIAQGANAGVVIATDQRNRPRKPARGSTPLNSTGIQTLTIASKQAWRAERVSRCHQILQASLGPGLKSPKWRCITFQEHGQLSGNQWAR